MTGWNDNISDRLGSWKDIKINPISFITFLNVTTRKFTIMQVARVSGVCVKIQLDSTGLDYSAKCIVKGCPDHWGQVRTLNSMLSPFLYSHK